MKEDEMIGQLLNSWQQEINLSEADIETIRRLAKPRFFKAKTAVLMAGKVCRHQTFICEGCLRVYYTDSKGGEHNVKFATEQGWAIDLQSFLEGTPAFFSIATLEPTRTVQIEKNVFDQLTKQNPSINLFFLRQFQNGYILLQQRMAQNLFSTAEEKYNHFLTKYVELERRISQRDIASYLGITPEFLSALKAKHRKSLR